MSHFKWAGDAFDSKTQQQVVFKFFCARTTICVKFCAAKLRKSRKYGNPAGTLFESSGLIIHPEKVTPPDCHLSWHKACFISKSSPQNKMTNQNDWPPRMSLNFDSSNLLIQNEFHDARVSECPQRTALIIAIPNTAADPVIPSHFAQSKTMSVQSECFQPSWRKCRITLFTLAAILEQFDKMSSRSELWLQAHVFGTIAITGVTESRFM